MHEEIEPRVWRHGLNVGGDRGLVAVLRTLKSLNCFSSHVTPEPDTYSRWQAGTAIYTQRSPK